MFLFNGFVIISSKSDQKWPSSEKIQKILKKTQIFCILHLLLDITEKGGKMYGSWVGLFSGLTKKEEVVMKRRKESVGFVLIVTMGIPLLFPSTSALTA